MDPTLEQVFDEDQRSISEDFHSARTNATFNDAMSRAKARQQETGATAAEGLDAMRERTQKEYEQQMAAASPTPEQIAERGAMPASEVIPSMARKTWNVATKAAAPIVDIPGHVAAGLIDIPHDMNQFIADGNKMFAEMGVPTLRFGGPDGWMSWTYDPQLEDTMTETLLNKVNLDRKGDPGEEHSIVRTLTRGIVGFMLTKRIMAASGLTAALARMGQGALMASRVTSPGVLSAAEWTGNTGMSLLQGALTDIWLLREDENIINGLRALGLPEYAWTEMLDSDEENPPMLNRVNNALAGAGFSALIPAFGLVFKQARSLLKRANTAAVRAADAGDESLMAIAKSTQAQNQAVRDQLTDLLGDPGQPVFRKAAAASADNAATSAAKPLADMADIIDDAAKSVPGRMDQYKRIADPLLDQINWSRINTADDLKRAISDFQEGFADEIAEAVGGKQTLRSVSAAAEEIDAFQVLLSGRALNKNAEALSDPEVIALRDFYVLAVRKFEQVARLYNRSPNTAGKTAMVKMMTIVREAQRQIRAESARRSRALGVLRIPAKEASGYDLYREVDQLLAGVDAEKNVDALANAVTKALNSEDGTGRIANILMNMDGLKGMGGKVEEGLKTLWYFSLLSRFTTQVRNAVGGPAHFLIKTAEMKIANTISNIMDDGAVYDGETTQYVMGFARGMSKALRLPKLMELWYDTATGRVADGTFSTRLADAVDGGMYKAFAENRSSFGGSMAHDIPTPVFGARPNAIMGHSTDENVGRMLNFLHAATVRAPRALMSLPQRGLNSVDELWKTSFAAADTQVNAYRTAYKEVLSGALPADKLMYRMNVLAADPTDAMKASADYAAREGTFTLAPTSGLGKSLEKFHNNRFLGPLLMPFSRAPQNITWQGIRRTPVGPFLELDQYMSSDPRIRDMAWSRFLLGNTVLLGLMDYFMDGKGVRIVGGMQPESVAESQQRRRMQMLEFNIQLSLDDPDFGGRILTIPFRGFEPVSFPLAIVSNMLQFMERDTINETDFEWSDLSWAMAAALGNSFLEQTTLTAMQDFFVAAGEDRLDKWAKNALTTPVTPGFTEQFVPLTDDVYRETFTMWENIKASTPGLSNSLPPARDAWGFAKKRVPGWGGVFQSVLPRVLDPELIQPIDRWAMKRGYFIGEPPKNDVEFRPGVEVKWRKFPEAYEHYKFLSGQALVAPERNVVVLKAMAQGRMSGPPSGWEISANLGLVHELNALVEGRHPNRGTQQFFNLLPDGEEGGKVNFIRQLISFYRAAAREIMLNDPKFSDLRADVEMKVNDAKSKEPNVKKRLRLGLGDGL